MNRAEAKTEFLELLRTDRKAARKCVKGKECGGRCIPQNWNCRLKGEGEVAPTRGNMVMRTPETAARVKKEQQARAAASRNSFLKSAALLGGAAAVGAALQRKGVKPEAMTSATTYAGGVASALNPALAGAATLISVGVAGGGAAAQNISRGIKSNATTSALSRRAKALELLKRGIDTRARKKKEQVIAERKSIEKLGEKITNATTDKARRTALAEMKTREKTLARMESELKKLQVGNKQRAARISRIQKRGYTSPVDVVKGASKTLKTAGKAGTRTQSTRQGVRRQFGLTGTGKSGPKVDPRSMIEKNLEDRADSVVYRGETFAGYNKPKRTPNHPKKSHAVLAKEGGRVKLIRFGQQGVKGSPKKEGESKSYAARRRSFKARHAKNISKGKMSAAYWANRSKW